MDEIDKKILKIIQNNANIPLSELSKKVGISSTPCWNRIKKFEEDGVIKSKATVLNNKKINLPIIVFLSISVSTHNKEWLDQFKNTINKYDQILEVYRLTSSISDYVLKIYAPSITQYDELQQQLINEIKFNKMISSICLSELKKNYHYPMDFI